MKQILSKFSLLCVTVMFLASCTVYTEKQTEALSQVVYATKDSLDNARIELADKYSEETTRIIKPPKNRIKIEPIYENSYLEDLTKNASEYKTSKLNSEEQLRPVSKLTVSGNSSLTSNSTKNPLIEKRRVLIVPEKFKGNPVVVVNSLEYENLLKDQEIFKQLQKDHENLTKAKKTVDEELTKQQKFYDQMIIDLNTMQKKLVEKDLAILQRNLIIVVLITLMGVATYLRIKGIL